MAAHVDERTIIIIPLLEVHVERLTEQSHPPTVYSLARWAHSLKINASAVAVNHAGRPLCSG